MSGDSLLIRDFVVDRGAVLSWKHGREQARAEKLDSRARSVTCRQGDHHGLIRTPMASVVSAIVMGTKIDSFATVCAASIDEWLMFFDGHGEILQAGNRWCLTSLCCVSEGKNDLVFQLMFSRCVGKDGGLYVSAFSCQCS